MKYKLICSLILMVFIVATGRAEDKVINGHDAVLYYPQAYGLEDLSVELYVEGLTEKINEQKIFGQVEKVFFRLYWSKGGRRDIEILGLPPGFEEAKKNIKSGMFDRFDFIFPTKLKDLLGGYTIKKRNDSFIATDSTGKKRVSEYILYFDSNKALSKQLASQPQARQEKKFEYKSGLKNLMVREKVLINNIYSDGGVKIHHHIDYLEKKGFMLPRTIETKITEYRLANKKEELGSSKTIKIKFENYEINNSQARQWFLKQGS